MSAPTWRKSSRSNTQGGNCVEVARTSTPAWRKGSRSTTQGGNCVEVAGSEAAVMVRDSKDPDGPTLAFTTAEWAAFTARLKA